MLHPDTLAGFITAALLFVAAALSSTSALAQASSNSDCEEHAGICGKKWDEALDAAAAASAANRRAEDARREREVDETIADYRKALADSHQRSAELAHARAQECFELARSAREMARDAWRRDAQLPGKGWDTVARRYLADARDREACAEEEENSATQLEQGADAESRFAEELLEKLEKAERQSEEAASISRQRTAEYEACLEEHMNQCVVPTVSLPDPERPIVPESTSSDGPVCGPDITQYVFSVLTQMVSDYGAANAENRKDACAAIIAIESAENAWDIAPLAPPATRSSGFNPDPQSTYWFEDISPACAIPRHYPCGPSVEFLGQCIHSQVVNYIQWGAMNKLCDQQSEPLFWHMARDRINRQSLYPGAHFSGQRIMTKLGAEFVNNEQYINERIEAGLVIYTEAYANRKRADWLKEHLDKVVVDYADWGNRAEAQCKPACSLSHRQQQMLGWKTWTYKWLGLD